MGVWFLSGELRQVRFIAYNRADMQYRKELRWLAFILAPFTAVLCLHIVIPLQFTTNCFGLLTAANDYASAGPHFRNTARATHLQNAIIVESIYARLATSLNFLLKTQLSNPNSQLNISQVNSTLVNGLALQQNRGVAVGGASSQQQYSVWYSDSAEPLSEASGLDQQSGVNQQSATYLSMQPHIMSVFRSYQQPLIASISTYYKGSNGSIVFQYPLPLTTPLTNPNFTTLQSNYQLILSSYQHHNNLSAVTPLFDENSRLLSFCMPAQTSNYACVICINFDLNTFAAVLSQQIKLLQSQFVSSNALITLQTISGNQQPVNLVLSFNSSGFQQAVLTNDSAFQFSSSNHNNQQVEFGKPNLHTIGEAEGDWYVTQVRSILPDDMYPINLVSQVRMGSTRETYAQLQSRLNTIVVVIVVFVFIETVIISVVLKKLLESVDQGLFELEHMTEMVLAGDISIEIPTYHGTEDIQQVYQQAKIINKLHRYSTQSYFSGHFSEKILKYVEALQFINSLKYDPGNLLQNLGEAYTYIEEWDHSLKYLKNSVENIMAKIVAKFGPYEQIYKKKLNKYSFPLQYREMELILIRRLFKLNFCYIKYLEFGPTWLKQVHIENPSDQLVKKKIEQLTIQFAENMTLIKKAFYPNFEKFSEILIVLTFESKNKLGNKKIEEAKDLFRKTEELYNVYRQNHPTVIKMLKEKGSKNKFLYSCNKLTFQSRFHPDLLLPLLAMIKTKIISASEPLPKKFNQIFHHYCQAFKANSITLNTAYMLGLEIRKSIVQLKIDPRPYESTQIFKQLVPFRTLYDEQLTKENELILLKKAGTQCVGLQREYIFLFDCERDMINGQKLDEFYEQRTTHIFEKLVKGHDRVSIVKFNIKESIKVDCSLTMKQSNQALLSKCLKQALRQKNRDSKMGNHLFEAVHRAVWRVKNLRQQKILIMFFRSLKHYSSIASRANKRRSNFIEKRKTQIFLEPQREDKQESNNFVPFDQFGDYLVEILRTPGLRNTKLILFCSRDSIQDFIRYFGLKDINRRIWAIHGGVNKQNNLVYIIQDKHKSDIDRILMPKVTDVPDNNIFIL